MNINERHANKRDLPKVHVVGVENDTGMCIGLVKPLQGLNHSTGDVNQLFSIDTSDLVIVE